MLRPVISAATAFVAEELGLECRIVSVESSEDGWVVMAEVISVDPEMRRLARKDLVITYELRLNDEMKVQSFGRSAMRERGSLAP